jgi:hypothetical protein
VTWLRLCEATVQVEVQGTNIVVVLRGTCFRAKYRKQEAPWLATAEFGPDDPEAAITSSEFRNLAWTAANEPALRWDGSRVATNCTEQQDRIRLHLMEGLLKQEDGQL